jgi:hypothetical protein
MKVKKGGAPLANDDLCLNFVKDQNFLPGTLFVPS